MSKKIIFVDESTFNKASKKLHQNLKENISNITLSKTKELLAESFGFKNYHGLQEFYKKEIIKKKSLTLNSDYYITLIGYLSEENNNSLWWTRAFGLFKAILNYLDKSHKGIFTTDDILYYLKIENLFNIINNNEPHNIKKDILDYFSSTPGYKQNDKEISEILSEQHSYLNTQLYNYLDIIRKIEKEGDILLFSLDWLRDRDDNFINQDILNDIYKKYTFKTWNEIHNQYLPSVDGRIMYKDKIYYSSLFVNSWLSDQLFIKHVLLEQLRIKKLNDIYLSDLLLIWKDVINIDLINISNKIMLNLLKNIDSVRKMSNEFDSLK